MYFQVNLIKFKKYKFFSSKKRMNSTEDYFETPTVLIIHDFIYSIKFKIILGTVWSLLLLLGILGKFNYY